MNAEAKTLAEYRCPVCGHSDPNAYQRCNHPACPDGRDPRPIDRLSAPGEGVGLTRYEPFQGQFAVLMETSPEGEWVRFEDATAALAAKEAVRRKSDEIGAMKAEQYVAERKAHEETKAERDALKAALGRRTDERIVNLNAEALAEIKAVVDGDSDQDVGHIIYGLLDELAALSTVMEPLVAVDPGDSMGRVYVHPALSVQPEETNP